MEKQKKMIKQELGADAPSDIGHVVAAASLGQVYRITIDGREYALKVQRPRLVSALARDVVILKGIGKLMRRIARKFCKTAVDPLQVVDSWACTLWDELDYKKEARSMEDMRLALSGISGLVIPRVYWQLSSLRVLTSEWVHGVKVTEDPTCVQTTHINVGVEAFASMILNVGVVHADPHAGNMIITDNGRKVCLLDFGMVVRVPPTHRSAWARCIVHLVQQEHAAVLEDLIAIGFFPEDCPRDDILPVMSKIWRQLVECGSDIKKRKVAVQLLYSEIMTLVRRFQFGLPDYYVALARALVTLEGIALAANCEFDIFQAIFPAAQRFLAASSAADSAALGRALALTAAREARQALLASLSARRAVAVVLTAFFIGTLVWLQLNVQ